jgi:hypothetical protein
MCTGLNDALEGLLFSPITDNLAFAQHEIPSYLVVFNLRRQYETFHPYSVCIFCWVLFPMCRAKHL